MLSHLDPYTLKCENEVNNFNCGCLPVQITISEEHIEITHA